MFWQVQKLLSIACEQPPLVFVALINLDLLFEQYLIDNCFNILKRFRFSYKTSDFFYFSVNKVLLIKC